MAKQDPNHCMIVLKKFPIKKTISDIKVIEEGHIHDSYIVSVSNENGESEPKYILQRINHNIFKDINALQDNIFLITTHIRSKLRDEGVQDLDKRVLTYIHTNDAGKYFFDGENYWRLALYVPNSVSHETVDEERAHQVGAAFAKFQSELTDFPTDQLNETIPNFHNLEFRLQELRTAVSEDKAGRLSSVKDLVDELEARAEEMTQLDRMQHRGEISKRIVHCDTKVSNLLFDKTTGEMLCVIDLDTVMPGYVLSDYGDFIRTAANTAAEDEKDLSKIALNIPLFESFTRGYIEQAKGFLTPTEIKLLPFGARWMTYMQAVRFLTDYINGDTYYKITYPEHNLVRTKAQMAYLKVLDEHAQEMEQFVSQWI